MPETKTHWATVLPAETGKYQGETTDWGSDQFSKPSGPKAQERAEDRRTKPLTITMLKSCRNWILSTSPNRRVTKAISGSQIDRDNGTLLNRKVLETENVNTPHTWKEPDAESLACVLRTGLYAGWELAFRLPEPLLIENILMKLKLMLNIVCQAPNQCLALQFAEVCLSSPTCIKPHVSGSYSYLDWFCQQEFRHTFLQTMCHHYLSQLMIHWLYCRCVFLLCRPEWWMFLNYWLSYFQSKRWWK